ncbi:hypothetical protein LO762_25965 [Actinocorallia sp. API 0066]|uniref:hypothetical protein n=1 Tax=Actinocorallia sp. API 0066 TaxID=2896846 RepID=UPI001E626515|nr:hypothetical protein [Actinocorallia sp. API 0066]MCD0452602.1 hypothetical protein [Actinocorallia sp. API 0066]
MRLLRLFPPLTSGGPQFRALALAVAAGTVLGGCSGSGDDDVPPPIHTPPPGATTFTADQLRQALLADIPHYVRAGEPDAGPYGMLKAVRNFTQLQSQVKLDKPECADATRALADAGELAAAPAALSTWARATGETITQTLVAVPPQVAEREVGRRVPKLCRTFKARVGGQWSTHQVVEQTPDRHLVGEGSRTVGLVTMSGDVKVNMWFVVFTSPGYLGTVSVYGPKATRAEAERLARDAVAQTERVLG